LKMPDLPEVAAPEQKPVNVGKVDDEYVLEDVSIVEDMIKESTQTAEPSQVFTEMKNWTPKPEVEQQLSVDELYKI